MSPRRCGGPLSPAARAALTSLGVHAGNAIREERRRRKLTLGAVARMAGIGEATLHRIEAGEPSSLESYVRVGTALSFRPELRFETRRTRPIRASDDPGADLVHAAMGELEARLLRSYGFRVAIDEPYQHYQFAGRSDVVAWDTERRTLLHLENRTQFPNIQEAAGSYNAKRAYMPRVLAERLEIPRWRSETHVLAVLWSAEPLHSLRLHRSTFEALCPDPIDAVVGWWRREPPTVGVSSTLIVIDPKPDIGRRRRFAGLAQLDRLEPRYRTYAEAAAGLRRRGP
jgi:transcriptional regulator with XRE-family HTH domain